MTYKEIKKKVKDFGQSLPISASNEKGEYVIIEEGKEDGLHFYVITLHKIIIGCV